MLCPKCGKEFEGNFCPNCGCSADTQTVCPSCGEVVVGKFCTNCGANLNDAKHHSTEPQQRYHHTDQSKVSRKEIIILAFAGSIIAISAILLALSKLFNW